MLLLFSSVQFSSVVDLTSLGTTLGALDHLHGSMIEMVLEKLSDEGFITYAENHIEFME